ncbi:MAG: HAD family hydrolase [Eubacteriaceae bacterium]|jgi:HAD superfamily hydrolase (TIGR01509 family)
MIRAAIFDMDGTLLDSMPMWDDAGAVYLAGLGIQAEPDLGKILFPMTLEESAVYLKKRYRLTLPEAEICAGIEQTISGFYLNSIPAKPGAAGFLEKLRDCGLALGVATVTSHQCTEAALRRTGLLQYFQTVTTDEDVGCGKDRPDIFLAAAKALGADPEETLVFEDALHALQTAKDAGFKTVGVYDASSLDKQQQILEVSDYYLKNFTDKARLPENLLYSD